MAPRKTVKIKCVEAIATADGVFQPTGGPLSDGVYAVPGTVGRELARAHPDYLLELG